MGLTSYFGGKPKSLFVGTSSLLVLVAILLRMHANDVLKLRF